MEIASRFILPRETRKQIVLMHWFAESRADEIRHRRGALRYAENRAGILQHLTTTENQGGFTAAIHRLQDFARLSFNGALFRLLEIGNSFPAVPLGNGSGIDYLVSHDLRESQSQT